MSKQHPLLFALWIASVVVGCTPANPPVTPWPTPDLRDAQTLCADLNTSWGNDWPRTISDLEKLHAQNGECDGADPSSKLYAAYYNYGAYLDAHGDVPNANQAYQNALGVNPRGIEAAQALRARNQFTPLPVQACLDDQVRKALDSVPFYTPQLRGGFVRADGNRLALAGAPYVIRGVNYYPVRAPWERFLAESDLAAVATELDLIQSVGFNTLRIFLDYDVLFDCPGGPAVPNATAFARLDGIIQLAAARNLRLVVTLNDLPNLGAQPLYLVPQSAAERTTYIVTRYRAEPAILAWDLRNEGDIDYTRGGYSSTLVLNWLSQLSTAVRQIDPNHLITAGWANDPQATESAVDVVSFHQYAASQSLPQRIEALRVYTRKPILVEEFGFSSLGADENQQATMLRDVASAAEDQAVGWLVWTAFDFPADVTCDPPACPGADSAEYHFGLWHTDSTPKPAVPILKALIAAAGATH